MTQARDNRAVIVRPCAHKKEPLDQCVFHLDEAAGEAFTVALENPPPPVQALRDLMESKAPWQ